MIATSTFKKMFLVLFFDSSLMVCKSYNVKLYDQTSYNVKLYDQTYPPRQFASFIHERANP